MSIERNPREKNKTRKVSTYSASPPTNQGPEETMKESYSSRWRPKQSLVLRDTDPANSDLCGWRNTLVLGKQDGILAKFRKDKSNLSSMWNKWVWEELWQGLLSFIYQAPMAASRTALQTSTTAPRALLPTALQGQNEDTRLNRNSLKKGTEIKEQTPNHNSDS